MKLRFNVKETFWESIMYVFSQSDINTKMPNIRISSDGNSKLYKSIYDKRSLNNRPVPSYRLYDASDKEIVTIYADTIYMRNWHVYEGDKQIAHLYTKHQAVVGLGLKTNNPELLFNDPLYIESNEYSLLTVTELGSFWSTGAKVLEEEKEIAVLRGADKETRDWILEFSSPENNKTWLICTLTAVFGWFYKYDM